MHVCVYVCVYVCVCVCVGVCVCSLCCVCLVGPCSLRPTPSPSESLRVPPSPVVPGLAAGKDVGQAPVGHIRISDLDRTRFEQIFCDFKRLLGIN